MSISGWFKKTFIGVGSLSYDVPSPADIVKREALSIVGSKVSFDLSRKNLNISFREDVSLEHYGVADTKSMDGIMDYGNAVVYLYPRDKHNHQIMVDWIAKTWQDSRGLKTCDCVYRIPPDFSQPAKAYTMHRLVGVAYDEEGRYFTFQGFNRRSNPIPDPYKVRNENILMLKVIQED